MSGSALKLLMMVLMVFDHIGAFISPSMASFFHFITRPVAPVFAYMAVEGFIYTKDVKKYLSRLYLFGFLMYFGNFILNYYIIKNPINYVYNNIIMTIALGVTGLYIYENIYLKKNKLQGIILLLFVGILSIFTEGGILIYPFILICYICRDNNFKRNIILCGITAFLLPTVIVPYETKKITIEMFFINSDILLPVAGIPFIYLYNGKRGNNSNFMKYIFYIFYPMHLWMIAIIADKFI